MSLITVKNLTFAYEGSYDNVFENLDLNIDTNWRLALIGRNGRGKTTLCRLLCGDIPSKQVFCGRVRCRYFPPEIEDSSLTVRCVAEKIIPNAEDWRLERELNLLGLYSDILERSFETLSYGEQTKAALAIMFLLENCFLLIDEPTNHLDAAGRYALGKYLSAKKGFVLASHDRALIDLCCDHVLSINRDSIELMQGNYTLWEESKNNVFKNQQKTNERISKQIEHLVKAASLSRGWSDKLEKTKYNHRISGLRPDRGHIGAKSAKLMKQRMNIENRINRDIEEKKKLLTDYEKKDPLKLVSEDAALKKIVELEDVSISYEEKTVLSAVSFSLKTKERLCLWGGNGSGKSSIIKAIMNEDINVAGKLYRQNGLRISYVPQYIDLKEKVAGFAERRGENEAVYRAMLVKLGFEEREFSSDINKLSYGQQRKVLLAQSISSRANLYIWDEPLNYLDIAAREQIEEVLLNSSPTMIFVEHDKVFCEKIATKIYQTANI